MDDESENKLMFMDDESTTHVIQQTQTNTILQWLDQHQLSKESTVKWIMRKICANSNTFLFFHSRDIYKPVIHVTVYVQKKVQGFANSVCWRRKKLNTPASPRLVYEKGNISGLTYFTSRTLQVAQVMNHIRRAASVYKVGPVEKIWLGACAFGIPFCCTIGWG